MSEETKDRENEEELEVLLGKLVPARLNIDLLAELNRECGRVSIEQAHSPTRIHWRRVIPLTLVGTMCMIAFGTLQFGHRFKTAPAQEGPNASLSVAVSPGSSLTGERLVPVSAQGFLMNSSSGGVVETEDGPRERVNMEYREAYHWHDPESGTNIRLFQPRSEEVMIPLKTD